MEHLARGSSNALCRLAMLQLFNSIAQQDVKVVLARRGSSRQLQQQHPATTPCWLRHCLLLPAHPPSTLTSLAVKPAICSHPPEQICCCYIPPLTPKLGQTATDIRTVKARRKPHTQQCCSQQCKAVCCATQKHARYKHVQPVHYELRQPLNVQCCTGQGAAGSTAE
jgi:hypothetical protein